MAIAPLIAKESDQIHRASFHSSTLCGHTNRVFWIDSAVATERYLQLKNHQVEHN